MLLLQRDSQISWWSRYEPVYYFLWKYKSQKRPNWQCPFQCEIFRFAVYRNERGNIAFGQEIERQPNTSPRSGTYIFPSPLCTPDVHKYFKTISLATSSFSCRLLLLFPTSEHISFCLLHSLPPSSKHLRWLHLSQVALSCLLHLCLRLMWCYRPHPIPPSYFLHRVDVWALCRRFSFVTDEDQPIIL